MRKLVTIESVKEALVSGLGEYLPEVEAIGIFGSLARGRFDQKRSDIDIFVVVREIEPETNDIWWKRITNSLSQFERDVTVLVYTTKGLKGVSNWHALRLASEGVIVYDEGSIAKLFSRMVAAAHKAGLEERETEDGRKIWTAKRPLKLGEVIEVVVKD